MQTKLQKSGRRYAVRLPKTVVRAAHREYVLDELVGVIRRHRLHEEAPFEHAAAQSHFGASVFWVRRLSVFPDEQESIAGWQIKRDGTRRGIVELISEAP